MKGLLVLIFIPGFLFSQNTKNAFAAFEKKVSKKDKIELINGCKDLKHCIANYKEFGAKDFYDGFHIIDFDKDGKDDIICNTACGESENNSIYFLKNKGTSYETVFKNIGKLLNLYFDSKTKALAFTIWHYPCCADNQNSYEEYIPRLNKGKISYKLLSTTVWIDGTKIPEVIDSSLKEEYQTILPTYKLRATPEIDDEIKLSEEGQVKGNVIAEYAKSSICIKLAEVTDKEGKVWWFVKMRNNIQPKRNRIYKNEGESSYNTFGWLSYKFLKKKG